MTENNRTREYLLALLLLVTVFAAQLYLFQATDLFTRHFWLDETHTYLTVSDPDLSHALEGLRGCVNGAPPTFFMLLRGFSHVLGGPSEFSFRMFSFLGAILGLWGLYLLLRKAFTPLVCFTATLATWAHPEVLRQSFQARYYSLWLAATVWFAFFLINVRNKDRKLLNSVLLAVSAMILCTVHYFGIIALGLIVGFAFLFDAQASLTKPRAWIPVAFGPIALALSLPYYFGQKAALAHPDHIPSPSAGQLVRVAGELVPVIGLPIVAVACWLSFVLFTRARKQRGTEADQETLTQLSGISGVLLLPAVLLILSFIIQPMMVARFALPMTAGLAVVIAYLLSKTARPVVACLLIYFAVLGGLGLTMYSRITTHKDNVTRDFIETVRSLPDDAPVAFEISKDFMVVARYAPDLHDRCFFLDFEEGEIGGVDKFRLSVRDMARIVERYYNTPSVIPWSTLRETPIFYVVPGHRYADDTTSLERDYEGFTATPIANNLVKMSRQ